jgi:tetratricopeptide (TPR) repeat protein
VRAQTASELGYATQAREALTTLGANGYATLPFDEEWLVSMGLLAETASTLGDVERAADLYRRLLAYGDRVAVCYMEISIGAVARYLGLLAATIGRPDDAARHFEEALATNKRIGARPWLARTQCDYACALLDHDASGNTDKAWLLLSQALTTYRELGMHTHAATASALTANLTG